MSAAQAHIPDSEAFENTRAFLTHAPLRRTLLRP